MDKGKLMNNLLVSNEPAYVKHFMLFFQELWDNYGIDAKERIKILKKDGIMTLKSLYILIEL